MRASTIAPSLPSPIDQLRCTASDHVHREPWILANDGETYCAHELGRLRGTAAPTGPVNVALTRAHKAFRVDNDEWHGALHDAIAFDTFRAPVQASNGESYSLDNIARALAHSGAFIDPRTPNKPMRRPARLAPNLAVQRLAAQVGGFSAQEDPYQLPSGNSTSVAHARAAFASMIYHEESFPIAASFYAGDTQAPAFAEWCNRFVTAMHATRLAVADGATHLAWQIAEIEARKDLSIPDVRRTYQLQWSYAFLRYALSIIFIDRFCGLTLHRQGVFVLLGTTAGVSALLAKATAWPLFAASLPLRDALGTHVREHVLRIRDERQVDRCVQAVNIAAFGAEMGLFFTVIAGGTAVTEHLSVLMGAALGFAGAYALYDVLVPKRRPAQAFVLQPLSQQP